MTHQAWQQRNDAYLAVRLEWLRASLTRMAESIHGAHKDDSVAADPDSSHRDNVGEWPDVEWKVELTATPALEYLRYRLGLSTYERDILLLCAAMEFDTRTPTLCAQAQDDANKPFPTYSLCMTLFDNAVWDALSPQRPLRRLRLLEIFQSSGTPLISSCLRIDERLVSYIKGLNYFDDRLGALMLPIAGSVPESGLTPSQQLVADSVVQTLAHATESAPLPVIQLLGTDQASKQQLASAIAAEFGRQLYRLPAEMIPTDLNEQDTLSRLWERESLLLPLALYIDANDLTSSTAADNQTSPLVRLLARSSGLVFVDTPQVRHNVGRPTEIVDIHKPTTTEQRQLWIELLGDEDSDLPRQLSSQFSLDTRSIHDIAARSASAGRASQSVPAFQPEAPARTDVLSPLWGEGQGEGFTESKFTNPIWTACRNHTRPRLDSLAQRIDCKATWFDLVLPEEQRRLLEEVTAQVRYRSKVYDDWGFAEKHNRGLGISVLFAGESGTGKTMAAEVIANDLQLDLYRIDLSQVVNKYIGETEKNLRKLFDAADSGGAILFFDEADALFGKRTEVKDAHDRYANIETNYLLQRMESYRGLAILATNLRSTLDKAFLRRLRFLINFPVPDANQRREIWRRAFPDSTPLADLDYTRLARLNLTGGNIHTIALNAAFSSTRAETGVRMPNVLSSAETEYRKLQKPASATEFNWQPTTGVPV